MCCADNKNFRRAYPYYPGMSWILFGLVDSVDIGYDFSKLIKTIYHIKIHILSMIVY